MSGQEQSHAERGSGTPTIPRSEFARLVDALVDGVVVIDNAGIMLRANQAACTMFGYTEAELLGRNVSMLMTAADAEDHDDYIRHYQKSGQGSVIGTSREVVGRHRDGQHLSLDLSVTPGAIGDNGVYIGFLRDITERKEAEALFNLNNKIMRSVNRALTNVINEGMSTREVFNSALEDLLEVTASEYGFIGEIMHEQSVPFLKTHAITNIAWNKETRDFYRENVRGGLEFRNLDTLFGVTIRSGQMVISNEPHDDARRGGLPKGHPPLRRYLGVPIYSGSKLLGMAGVANREGGYNEELVDQIRPLLSVFGTLIAAHQNRESRIRAEEALFRTQQQLKQMATKDPITGIANRYLLVQELEVAYEQCVASGEDLAVLFIDVDHFKQVNDRHGHDLGDAVLRHVAARLEDAVRPTDIIGRYGGEEFLVGLPGCPTTKAEAIADRMRASVHAVPYELADGRALTLSVSIGIGALSQQPRDLNHLIKLADEAVYAAKREGRNRVVRLR